MELKGSGGDDRTKTTPLSIMIILLKTKMSYMYITKL